MTECQVHTRRTLRGTPRVLVSALLATGLAALSCPAAAAAASEEQLKQLIVMLQVKLGEQTYNGAGLIVGKNADQLYIVTAKHVVREGMQQAESVKVRFKWLPGEWREAKLLDDFDDQLDLAVLAVARASELSAPDLAWAALSSPSRLKPGQEVTPIGYPDGRAWFTPRLPHRIQQVTRDYVETQGELFSGNSGGALVTQDWGVVAIVSRIRPPTNQSSRIDLVLDKLREWGYPVALTDSPSGTTGQHPSGDPTDKAAAQRARWKTYDFPPPNAGPVLYTIMPDGNPACASYNGSQCLWGMTAEQIDFAKLKPLVCGEGHRAQWGVTGYETPEHWCSLARKLPRD